MTLYERIGGTPAITAAVGRMYVHILADPSVSHYFTSTDMAHQHKQQIDFMVMAMGGPNNYQGKDMRVAHEKMKLKVDHFMAIWTHLEKGLHELNVPQNLIDQVKEVVVSTKAEILNE